MKTLRIVSLVLTTLMAVGCASAPKPVMTEQMVVGSAVNWVVIKKCGAQGDMSPELAAEGIRIFNVKLSAYSYDAAQINKHVNELSVKYPKVNKEDCNKMAVTIAGTSKQWERNNRESDALIADNNRAMDIKAPVNTYCTSISSQTFCRTQ